MHQSWRKEKVGIKELWDETKQNLAKLRKVERIRRRRKRIEKERTNFFRENKPCNN